jgi:hypothetical protein
VCEDFRTLFEAQMHASDGRTRWLWVDIEDDEDLLGTVEVDDFPTLLIADRRGPRFFGVIAPSTTALQRALRRASHEGASTGVEDPDLQALSARLRERARIG